MGNYDKLLNDLYYVEKNYDGINILYQKAKLLNKNIKKDDVKQWLNSQEVQQQTAIDKIQKPEYKPIYSEGHYDFQIDLTFLPKYQSQNNKYYVIFTAINVNSRYAYCYYAKNKEASSIIDMLNDFLKNSLIIETITCDKGSEFTDGNVKKWFNENNIRVFYVKDDEHRKLGIINRFHRTLKEKLLKLFIAENSTRWIDNIDKIIKNYNNSKHSGIYNFTPKEASKSIIMSYIISRKRDKTENVNDNILLFEIGQKVRLLNNKKLFDKMQSKYDDKIYTIIKINKNTLDIEDDKNTIKNVKKDYVKIIQENKKNINQNNITQPTKKEVEKNYKVERLLKKEGINPENIIIGKRNR